MSKMIASLAKIQGYLIAYFRGDRGLGADAVGAVVSVHITQNNRADTNRRLAPSA